AIESLRVDSTRGCGSGGGGLLSFIPRRVSENRLVRCKLGSDFNERGIGAARGVRGLTRLPREALDRRGGTDAEGRFRRTSIGWTSIRVRDVDRRCDAQRKPTRLSDRRTQW